MYVFSIDINTSTTLIIGIAGLIITVIIAVQNQSLSNQQMMKQLFTEFNQRYGRLNDCLIEIETNCPTIEAFNSHIKSNFYKRKILDYFNLCAEEYYWHKKGRIDDSIWESWKAGMNYWHDHVPTIRDLWHEEMETSGPTSYYITKRNEIFTTAKI